MSLMMDGDRVPTRWAARHSSHRVRRVDLHSKPGDCLRIALVNNMPDSALEDTEMQFFGLLDAAAEDLPVHIDLYSLPNIPRGERAQQHLDKFYSGIDSLLSSRYDGVIVTGTEPRKSDLREEPYWSALTEVFDWAERNTTSAVLSCLAAHARVLHSDGIERHRLAEKCCGVFEELRVSDHTLVQGAGKSMCFPHSRWNQLEESDLVSAGYDVLTKSKEAGVNLFVKEKGKSLFICFQGHPEYGPRTLLREYRRDVGRFLRREHETYPTMPKGYFDAMSTKVLNDFRENAIGNSHRELMNEFPEGIVDPSLQSRWQVPAVNIYCNWLRYTASKRAYASRWSISAGTGLR